MGFLTEYLNRIDIFILIIVRMTGIFVIAPIFGARNLPTYFKIGFAFMTSLIVSSTIAPVQINLNNSLIMFSVMIFKELAVGFIIGFVAYIIFTAIYIAGQIIDMQIGFGVVNIMDPMSNIQVPITGNFYYILTLLIFLMIDGHHFLIAALFKSYEILPIGSAVVTNELLSTMIRLFTDMFIIGFKISAPILMTILITDVGLGILTKTMPQLNVFIVGMPLKIFIGLVIMVITIPAFVNVVDVLNKVMTNDTFEVIEGMIPK